MTDHARVVVVGGGVTGCSVLYHLVKKGWSDVVLCERTELTSGSTWHSAGHVILYTLNETISRLNQYGVDLYRRLEAETGQNPGFHTCGNLRLATHPDRLLEMKRYLGVARVTGVEAVMLDPDEIGNLHPLMDMDGVLGGVFNPTDGHIAPADLTQAFATGARQGGAKIRRQTEVIGFEQQKGGEWLVRTDKGDILCEHVVSATGNYTKQTLAMLGRPGHSVPVKHQFVVTEPIPDLVERKAAGLPELPVFRDPEQSFYVRQEGVGLAMGAYEEKGEAVFVAGVPASFGQDLFPDELDKLLPFLERAMGRIPALAEAGIKDVINGPMPYTPDDMPLTGPAAGLTNFWLAEGNPFGITLAGGIGWQLAEWIVEGEPSIDMWPCDSRRFGSHATRAYSAVKTEEAYEHTYRIPKPGEELEAARGMKTSPIHDLLAARGAVFGEVAGWERPNWFATEGTEPVEHASFGRSNAFAPVGTEFEALTTTAGVADATATTRFAVSGPGAAAFLDTLVASTLPEVGSVGSGLILSHRGTIRSEISLWRRSENDFFVTGPIAAENYDLDLLLKAAAGSGVAVENLTGRYGGLQLLGPRVRDILVAIDDRATAEDGVIDDAARACTLALLPALVLRTAIGETAGYAIHTAAEHLRRIFLALVEAGADHGLKPVGARALAALGLEAGLPGWPSEFGRSVDPFSAGLGAVVDFKKPEFRGRDAAFSLSKAAPAQRLVRLAFDADCERDPLGAEAVCDSDGTLIGATTSGGYGYGSGRPLAFAYVDAGTAADDRPCTVTLLGEDFGATMRVV